MTERQRRIVMCGAVAIYLMGLGFLGGIAAERIRFDLERGAAVARLEAAARQLHAEKMIMERAAGENAAR